MRERAMSPLQQTSVRNRLLAALNPDEFWLLQPHLEPVPLGLRQWVIETQQPIQHVYFPKHGIISLLADTAEGRIEIGIVGPEGMAGVPVVRCLGSTTARTATWSRQKARPCASPPRTSEQPCGI